MRALLQWSVAIQRQCMHTPGIVIRSVERAYSRYDNRLQLVGRPMREPRTQSLGLRNGPQHRQRVALPRFRVVREDAVASVVGEKEGLVR